MRYFLLVAAIVLIVAPAGVGCPVCDSEQGRQVRAGVLDDRFLLNVAQTAAPFPVLALVVGVLCMMAPGPGTPRERRHGR